MPPAPPQLRKYHELDGKTLLLGVGGTKCATSWVYSYLRSLQGVRVSPLKELHFFNAKLGSHAADEKTEFALKRLTFHIMQEGDPVENLRSRPAFQASLDRVKMIYDDNAYFGHFARLCRPDTRTLCDITPAYSPLGRAGFEYIKDFCASQDLALKLFFIMRDPVERLWSHLRFLQQNDESRDVLSTWREMIQDPAVIERTDYRLVVDGLNEVFAEHNVLYLFYEDLFSGGALKHLSAFAGADHVPPDTGQAVNETAVKIDMPDDVRGELRDLLAPQYAFCRQVFGDSVPASWQA